MPFWLMAQSDTSIASKNVYETIIFIDNSGNINQNTTKDVGEKLPHLVIFNLADSKVNIKLSIDGQTWSEFLLEPISKDLFRCDNIQRLFVIIDPASTNSIKAKIYRAKKYKIFYDVRLKLFDIVEIP
jgi:hypothetical protein